MYNESYNILNQKTDLNELQGIIQPKTAQPAASNDNMMLNYHSESTVSAITDQLYPVPKKSQLLYLMDNIFSPHPCRLTLLLTHILMSFSSCINK